VSTLLVTTTPNKIKELDSSTLNMLNGLFYFTKKFSVEKIKQQLIIEH